MDKKKIKKNLESLEVGEDGHIAEDTYAIRTSKNKWSVMEDGEEVSRLSLNEAVRIVQENLGIEAS